MIKVALLDLDDTLITSNIQTFFADYLTLLTAHSTHIAPPEAFVRHLLDAYTRTLAEYRPTETLYPRYLNHLSSLTGQTPDVLKAHFESFYVNQYMELQRHVQPRADTLRLLAWLHGHGIAVVVATNPAFPLLATGPRMAWGGITAGVVPVAMVTTLDHMHFGKPQAQYYAEILLRLDVEPCEAIMVGDEWDNDIVGAAAAGLHTYWVTAEGTGPPHAEVHVDGVGSYSTFVEQVWDGWLETLQCHELGCEELVYRLEAFPAALDAERRSHTRDILECCPGEREWSARDIICHLRDHEMADRDRLRQILREDNPFLSANTDPWENYGEYRSIPLEQALEEFVRVRADTVACLKEICGDAWQRPARDAIFGPTTFIEVVQFLGEHDRTHLRQMRDALAYALEICGSDSID
jgi:FMN phosphatase YigB (HAD superfamily)